MEKNKTLESSYPFADSFFLVFSGYLVWLGILFLHRLALGR